MENNLAALFGFDGDEYTLDRVYFYNVDGPILTAHINESGADYVRTVHGSEALQKLKVLEQNKFPVKKR